MEVIESSKGEYRGIFRTSNAHNFFWAGNNINNVYILRERGILEDFESVQDKVDFSSEPVQVGNDQNHHFA